MKLSDLHTEEGITKLYYAVATLYSKRIINLSVSDGKITASPQICFNIASNLMVGRRVNNLISVNDYTPVDEYITISFQAPIEVFVQEKIVAHTFKLTPINKCVDDGYVIEHIAGAFDGNRNDWTTRDHDYYTSSINKEITNLDLESSLRTVSMMSAKMNRTFRDHFIQRQLNFEHQKNTPVVPADPLDYDRGEMEQAVDLTERLIILLSKKRDTSSPFTTIFTKNLKTAVSKQSLDIVNSIKVEFISKRHRDTTQDKELKEDK